MTVNCGPEDLRADKLPSPLQEYGERTDRPGTRGPRHRAGRARFKQPPSDLARSVPARLAGQDPRQDLRRALREAKALKLRERTGGRGPDVCIEAVGMEAHSGSPVHLYDQVKQQLRLQTDRPTAVRQAIHACRKGGTVFVLGVFAGAVDKFPLDAVINKGLTVRGAQQHGQRYIPMLLERMAAGELSTAHLATHTLSLDEAQRAYDMFKQKSDGCVRAVLRPGG